MTTSASTKDLSRAISTFFQSPSLPLPDDLNEVVAAYLNRHEKCDEGAADRLNDELSSIYQRSVAGRPDRYAAFLTILRRLRPALRTPFRIMQWWDRLVEPVLDNLNLEKGLAKEALTNVLELMAFDEDEYDKHPAAGPNIFADRLLSRWMQLYHPNQGIIGDSSDHKERMLRETIMIFGKKAPKGFMTALNGFFVKKDYRNRSLNLLCDFVQSRPPHLHEVLETPLFGNILQSLQQDDSTTTIDLALVSLFMLLPNMPSALVPYLPTLFNIYARLLFWDRSFAKIHTGWEATSPGPRGSATWEKCLFDNDMDGDHVRNLPVYFTILYGLYPINFVEYIRKPEKYLRNVNNAEDIDVQDTEIRDRSERYRRCHLLHPNFYNLTMEKEKTDFSRWIKSEPAEVLTDCLALRLTQENRPDSGVDVHPEGSPAPGTAAQLGNDEINKDDPDPALLSGSHAGHVSSPRDSQSSQPRHMATAESSSISRVSMREALESRPRDMGGDSPTLPAHLVPSPSHNQLQDMIHSNRAIKSGLHQSLANDSVPSLALSHPESIPERGFSQLQPAQQPTSSLTTAELTSQVAQLHRQNLLLQNDLNFERYMKQQHMAHIGELKRKQLREAATEAETQNLILANHSLKQRLEEAKRLELQIKKESDSRRDMSKKWESELSAKLRTLREEQKKWTAEGTILKRDLQNARAECERLRQIITEAADRELRSKQDAEAVEISGEEIERLKAEIKRLTASERRYQGMETKMQTALRETNEAETRVGKLMNEIDARETQLLQAKSHIVVLNTKLAEANKTVQEHVDHDASVMLLKSALATCRTKQADMQKQYSQLQRKYTALQSSFLDIQCDAAKKTAIRSSLDGDFGETPKATSPMTSPINIIRNRPYRGFSDPEASEPISNSHNATHHATSALEQAVSTSAGSGGVHARPSTPPGNGAVDPLQQGTRTSPHSERYYGRGGVQNTFRKGSKDSTGKKDDKPDKKDKKSGGSRGMRGFV